MNHKEHFAHFAALDCKRVEGAPATGWIQWKGTAVCLDFRCRCGHQAHFDGDFMYYFRCSGCGTTYHPQTTIAFEEVTDDHLAFVKEQYATVIQTAPPE